MTPSSDRSITVLLGEARQGDEEAVERLWASVYGDLRRIAHRELYRRRPGHQTLQTTALVNEVYLKLVDQQQADWEDRVHFFAVAAKAMRHILIDYARKQSRQKRGGGQRPVSFEEDLVAAEERAETFLALDEALTHLAARDEHLAQLVEYRFFGGMMEKEIASLLGVSERTVRRDWRRAKIWLADTLEEPD